MSLELFKEVMNDRALVTIGKSGITPNILEHIKTLLKKNKILKIKVMRDMVTEHGMEHFIAAVMKGLKILVLDARGHTFIISKKKVTGVHIPKKFGKLLEDSEESTPIEAEAEVKAEAEAEVLLDENGEVVDMNPEFIDYDDENLLHRIDQQSDEIYGATETKQPKKKIKRPRPNLRDNKKHPKSGARSNSAKFAPKKSDSRSRPSKKRFSKYKKRS